MANGLFATQNKMLHPAFNIALLTIGEKLLVKKSVRELLFDGYEDPILTTAQKMSKTPKLSKLLKLPKLPNLPKVPKLPKVPSKALISSQVT